MGGADGPGSIADSYLNSELSNTAPPWLPSPPQPAIPVFTVSLGIWLQMETGNTQKLVGIGLAVVGAVSMVRCLPARA